MSKKRKKTTNHDYDKIESEILREKVNEIFRDHPHDYISKLEDIGFEYFEDDMPDEETEESESMGPGADINRNPRSPAHEIQYLSTFYPCILFLKLINALPMNMHNASDYRTILRT